MNTCCFEDFKSLISTTAGQNRIKAEYTATFNRPAVGHCENSLRDMYDFLRIKNDKNKIEMVGKFKVKKGSEILYIGGSRTDISEWNQKQIHDYLISFPRAIGHFEKVEETEKKEGKKKVEETEKKEDELNDTK